MTSVMQMFTWSSRKKEERKRFGSVLEHPKQTSPKHPPPSTGPTTRRQPSGPQPQGTYPNWGSDPAPLVAPPNTQDDEQVAWFTAIDQDNSGQVSAEELQSALMNGYGGKRMSFCSQFRGHVLITPRAGPGFSSQTVKYLMSVFDLDGSGEIGIEEFKPLWDYVKQWREMFESFDYNQDGIIDATELSNALSHYNLQVGPIVINFLVHKYGTHPTNGQNGPPQIELDRFVCACVVVQQMCALYDRCGAGRAGSMEVNRDEFLLTILRLP
ncbi:hypothetical protein EDB89DRAFT_2072771 [Lactarius sanguifluus]|nr:hypothetical protein EDB89DRAFT_2073158 [Lactarius sanguifluus]KAH9169657.1 hypothetical protein EDB89DRAFT_2072771 [Lactarius sanguifluus]